MEATKKVYVHYEGEPEFTHVAVIKLGLTAEQLAEEFTRAYNAKHGKAVSLDPASINLVNGRRRISKSENLIRFVKDRSDIFVEHESERRNHLLGFYAEHVSTSNEADDAKMDLQLIGGSNELAVDQDLISLIEPELAAAAQRVQKVGQELEEPSILGGLLYGLKCQQLRKYKAAVEIFLLILDVFPIQQICLRGLGSMALAVHDYPDALTWLQIGVREYPMDDGFHARLGDAYVGLRMYEEALDEYDLATGLISEQQPLAITSKDISYEHLTMDIRLQSALERLQCDPLLVYYPGAGDILGPATRDGLKTSSEVAYEGIRQRQSKINAMDGSLNMERKHIPGGDRAQFLEDTKSILVSGSLLCFGDDLLLQSVSSPPSALERTMDSISIPAFLLDEDTKVRIQVVKNPV